MSTLVKFFVCLMVRVTDQRGTQNSGNGLGLTVPAASGTLGGSSPTANLVSVNIRGKGEFSRLESRAFICGPAWYLRRRRRFVRR